MFFAALRFLTAPADDGRLARRLREIRTDATLARRPRHDTSETAQDALTCATCGKRLLMVDLVQGHAPRCGGAA